MDGTGQERNDEFVRKLSPLTINIERAGAPGPALSISKEEKRNRLTNATLSRVCIICWTHTLRHSNDHTMFFMSLF